MSQSLSIEEESANLFTVTGALTPGYWFFGIQNTGEQDLTQQVYLELGLKHSALEFVGEYKPDFIRHNRWLSSGEAEVGSPGNIQYALTLEEPSNVNAHLLNSENGFIAVLDSNFNKLVDNHLATVNLELAEGTYYIEVSSGLEDERSDFTLATYVNNPLAFASVTFHQTLAKTKIGEAVDELEADQVDFVSLSEIEAQPTQAHLLFMTLQSLMNHDFYHSQFESENNGFLKK